MYEALWNKTIAEYFPDTSLHLEVSRPVQIDTSPAYFQASKCCVLRKASIRFKQTDFVASVIEAVEEHRDVVFVHGQRTNSNQHRQLRQYFSMDSKSLFIFYLWSEATVSCSEYHSFGVTAIALGLVTEVTRLKYVCTETLKGIVHHIGARI